MKNVLFALLWAGLPTSGHMVGQQRRGSPALLHPPDECPAQDPRACEHDTEHYHKSLQHTAGDTQLFL